VVELLAGKLSRLPENTQEVISQLGCLGHSAGSAILGIVRESSEDALHSVFQEAVQAGLVYRQNDTYVFMHDRVQEAAYALIPEDARAHLHLRIGRSLIAKMTDEESEANIFNIVNQLNSGRALISDLQEKERVAELNLRAGRKAKASAAYASACVYLSTGMGLVGSNGWERRYELAFGLRLKRAFASFSWHHLITGLLLQGVRLDEVWRESQNGIDFVRKVKFRGEDGIPQSQRRFILTVRGETDVADMQFHPLSFEALFGERKPFTVFHSWTLELQLRYIFADYEMAILAAQKAKALLWWSEQHIQSVDYYYYSALTATALYETTGAEKRIEIVEGVQQSLKWLREWVESCPGTFLDKHTLVLAEVARIEGRDLDAMRLYEEAIRSAHQNGFIQNEAVAYEVAARFYAARGFETFAQAYIKNARYCYLR
jgi:hypothetical protein